MLLIFFRSQKVIDHFKAAPLGPIHADYYPPLKQYNSLLRKLRFLGIYHDEHMVFFDFLLVFLKNDFFNFVNVM